MNFVEELKWRNMLHDMTPGAEDELMKGMQTGYIGFDPTAPSMTIGNYVQIMLLRQFQLAGHSPILLMGGATGRIGDPSGKAKERQLKSYDELDRNLAFQQKQAEKFLDFEDSPNKAIVVNNHDFYKNMNIMDFLRDAGKTITVSYMLSKESVKKRLETGLSFTEFSYQLLQAYDFQYLYDKHNCKFQMGGSDQWGNITSGTEFIRRNQGGKAYALTTPLLTKADGSKFGKSEGGNIWLDPKMTSPYKFYQFWLNADDADLAKYFRYFSFKSREEIESLELEYANDPRFIKKILAQEITKRVHSDNDYKNVLKVSELLFNKKATAEILMSLDGDTLEIIAGEIPSFQLSKDMLSNGINIVDLLSEKTQILSSKSEAKRALKSNAISINKTKIMDDQTIVNSENLIEGKYIMIDNGKKNKYMLVFV